MGADAREGADHQHACPCARPAALMEAIALEGQEEMGWMRSRDAAGGRSHKVRPRSEIDVLSGYVNQVTPVAPQLVVEV